MNAPTTALPESVATDPTEVADALDVARTLCEKGALEDALRWLRRAVDAASETAGAERVATLAHAAADLAQRASRASVPIAPSSQIRLASSASTRPTPVPTASSRPTQPPPAPRPASRPTVTVPPPPPRPSVRIETRVRVSVRTSARDPDLLVVRTLKDRQPLPRGTREAFLVMSEPCEGEETGGDQGEDIDIDVVGVTGTRR